MERERVTMEKTLASEKWLQEKSVPPGFSESFYNHAESTLLNGYMVHLHVDGALLLRDRLRENGFAVNVYSISDGEGGFRNGAKIALI